VAAATITVVRRVECRSLAFVGSTMGGVEVSRRAVLLESSASAG